MVFNFLDALLTLISFSSIPVNSSDMYLDQPIMFLMSVQEISKAHNNGRVVQFIEPSECRMGGEALQLLRIL